MAKIKIGNEANSFIITEENGYLSMSTAEQALQLLGGIPLTGGAIQGNLDVTGALTVSNLQCNGYLTTAGISILNSIEITGSTPYINFHANGDTSNYTSRIIENTAGTLSITGGLEVGGSLVSPSRMFARAGISADLYAPVDVGELYAQTPVVITSYNTTSGMSGVPAIGFHFNGIAGAAICMDSTRTFYKIEAGSETFYKIYDESNLATAPEIQSLSARITALGG